VNRSWLKYLPHPLRARLDSRHSLQKIISNSGWLFADKLIRIGIGLTLGIWIARYLGPENFGLLSYSVAFVSLFTTIATLGLDGIVVRELTVHPTQEPIILGSTFVLKFAGGLFAYAAVLGTITFMQPTNSETPVLITIVGGGLVFLAFDVSDFWFQSKVQAKYVVCARCSAFLALCVVRVWLLRKEANLVAFAWVNLLEAALSAGTLAIAFKATGNSLTALRFEWAVAWRLLSQSWPLAISGMFVLLTMQLDKILLGEIAGPKDVGIYNVANQLSALWYMVPMIVGSSITPFIVRARATNDANYLINLQKVYTTLTRIAVGTAIAVFFLSTPGITFLFGSEYHEAAPVLAVHIWSGIFVFHVSVRTRAFVAEGKQRFITAMAALTLLTNIVLNFLLIEPYGALGAAYASLISWSLCATLYPALWPETRYSVVMFLSSFGVQHLR
jgi:polysaccharide transporter, PST family